MSESGFFSGLSVVIVADKNEPIEWLSDLVSTARREASEIIIVIEHDADPLAMRPTIGSFERVRLLFQQGSTKADALNTGLQSAKNTFVAFVDADVVLEPSMLEAVLAILEGDADHDAAEFVSVGYRARSPSFTPVGFVAGWFF